MERTSSTKTFLQLATKREACSIDELHRWSIFLDLIASLFAWILGSHFAKSWTALTKAGGNVQKESNSSLMKPGMRVTRAQSTSWNPKVLKRDDCIATIVRHSSNRIAIASGDKDLNQMLEPDRVTILRKCKRNFGNLQCDWMTAARLKKDTGLAPNQWVDYQTLVGDSTDKIAGCKGVGPKAAKALLSSCGSLDAFYAKPFGANITKSARAKVLAFKPDREHVRSLVELRRDVPIEHYLEVTA